MEVVAYGALTTLWWIASYTVLLPFVFLLRQSKAFQNRWFTWIFGTVISKTVGKKLLPLREKCFQLLKDELDKRGGPTGLRILEIGVGGGPNLKFYPENSSLIAVDMNPNFEKSFNETRKEYPQVKLERIVHAMAEDMSSVEDDSVDVAVSTYVLCSVEDVDKVLKEIRRVLKPGGLFAFLEHVAYEEQRWGSTIQRMVRPLWCLYFDGCCPDRDIETSIKDVGFSRVDCKKMEVSDLWLYIRPQITGLAVK